MSGTNEAIGGGGFHHISIKVGDFDAAMKFYTEALGFCEKRIWGEEGSQTVLLDTGDGNYLEMSAGGSDKIHQDGGPWHLALRCGDVDAAVARVRAAGAEITEEPKDVEIPSRPEPTPVRLAFFRAPGGILIEFFQNETT
jgi:glyoxylase I family protein